jgi:hypothetical protein
MPATFCLASTLHTGNPAGKKLLAGLLAEAPKGYRVCYLGCYHDDSDWGRVTVDFFQKKLGAECWWPKLSDPDLDVAAARKQIETAEVLYLDGGDTVAGVEHTRSRGLLPSLRKAAKNAFLVYGLSGGACAAGPYTIGYGDDDEGYVAPCYDMGIPLPLDVHDEENDWPEMRSLLELVAKDRKIKKKAGIVIPTGSALVKTKEGELRTLGKALVEERSLDGEGEWTVERYPAIR